MRKLILRGLAERRSRLAGVVLAVFLGVSLVAGSLVFTDTINASFDKLFERSLKGSDVVVTPREVVRQDKDEPPPFSAALLDRVRDVDGVEAASGARVRRGPAGGRRRTRAWERASRPTSSPRPCRSGSTR